jgi:hypothetical protein
MTSKLFASVLGATLISVSAWAIQPTSQPVDEITVQRTLPQVNDALWTKLINCKLDYNEENGVYSIKLTPEVKALDGRTVTLRGFVLPMDGSDRTKHFLISRNTPVCMYCPPGQPNEVVEVYSSRAITWTSKVVAVTGKLNLVNDQEQAIFFKIEGAEVK